MHYSCNFDLLNDVTYYCRYYVVFVFRCKQVVFLCQKCNFFTMFMYLKSVTFGDHPVDCISINSILLFIFLITLANNVLHNEPYLHTPCPKKTCDYIFYHNFNSKCPISIIFGIVSIKSMCHRKMVSFPTSPI